jgi:hypothetical protein
MIMKWVYLEKGRDRRAVRLYHRRWQAGPRRHRCRLRHKNATSPRPTSSCVSMSTKASGGPIPLDAQDGGYRRAFVRFVFVAGMSFDARRPLNPNGGRTKKAHTSASLAKVTRSPYRCWIEPSSQLTWQRDIGRSPKETSKILFIEQPLTKNPTPTTSLGGVI